MAALVPTPAALEHDRSAVVARCVLGLTLYLADSERWSRTGASRLLRAFLSYIPAESLRWFETSATPGWRTASSCSSELPALLSSPSGVRHLFRFRLADRRACPERWFDYLESDERRGCSVLRVGLAPHDEPAVLFQLALEALHGGPVHCGSAGYAGEIDERFPCEGFAVLHRWARRYWGMDVQHPVRARFRAPHALICSSWLTMLGPALLARAAQHDLEARVRAGGGEWMEVGGQALVRAGPSPSLADSNLLEHDSAMRGVACALAPLADDAPTRLYGGFWESDGTERWRARHVEPEGWV